MSLKPFYQKNKRKQPEVFLNLLLSVKQIYFHISNCVIIKPLETQLVCCGVASID